MEKYFSFHFGYQKNKKSLHYIFQNSLFKKIKKVDISENRRFIYLHFFKICNKLKTVEFFSNILIVGYAIQKYWSNGISFTIGISKDAPVKKFTKT